MRRTRRRGGAMRITGLAAAATLLAVLPLGGCGGGEFDCDVVVVGGGVSGLVTAYALQKEGIQARVLEAQHRLGGRVATMEYGELRAEAGLQEIWEESPLLPLLEELDVKVLPAGGAYSSLILHGKQVPFDHDRLEDFLATFLPPDGVTALTDWLTEAKRLRDRANETGLDDPEVRALQDISFQAWVDSCGLPPDAAEWVRLSLGCEVATELTSISALGGLMSFGIFLDGGQECFEVEGGNSRMIEALADAIRAPITLDARVTEIRRAKDGGGALEVLYQQGLASRSLRARRVVVAIPFLYLHFLEYDPPLSGDRWGAINSLGRGQYTVVHFLIDGTSPVLTGETHFPYLTYGPAGVIYGPGEPVDEGGDRVFSLLVYGAFAQAYHLTPKTLMTSGVAAVLDAQWPGFSDHVVDTHVYTYHPAAVAFHPVGRSPFDDWAKGLRAPTDEGIRFVGPYQYGSHSHDAARSALETAAAIAAELGGKRR